MRVGDLSCRKEHRCEDVRTSGVFGLDYVEVVDDTQTTLRVFFLGKAPQNFSQANVALTGGRRIRDVRVLSVRVMRQPDATVDDYFEVHVDKPGDFSQYIIRAVNAQAGEPTGQPGGQPMDGFDPRYVQVSFSFKAGCSTDLDCKPVCTCPPATRTQPDIDYLAKDYESFRQLMLDRMALTMLAWQESHAPDIGITLVELLAYAGDSLSYFQDAVATEAYLGTARQRISVHRHARLVDYRMHEGCNARAWITFSAQSDQVFNAAQVYFITAYPGAPQTPVLSQRDLTAVPPTAYEAFSPLFWNGDTTQIAIFAAHSEIAFYTWGECGCCLAPGATSATLADAWEPENPGVGDNPPGDRPNALRAKAAATERLRVLRNLKVGDILIFEEVKGPKTGAAPDADPTHRQAVRLTKVTPSLDPLYGPPDGTPVVEIEWAAEDALRFTLCISSQEPYPDCGCMENVSVARGNVVIVDNGVPATETVGMVPTVSTAPRCPEHCEPGGIDVLPGLFRPTLSQSPLTFSAPLSVCSAVAMLQQDPRQAFPWITLASIPPAPACADPAPNPPPPCTVQPLFTFDDMTLLESVAERLKNPQTAADYSLRAQLSAATEQALAAWDGTPPAPAALLAAVLSDLQTLLETWTPQLDLLESAPGNRNFVAEIDNDGIAHLRFGDGVCGEQPEAGESFRATYRVGNGAAGNVGAETLIYLVLREDVVSGLDVRVRNPLAASGGTDPESMDDVRLFAPFAFRNQRERAITADDYATIAGDNQRRLDARAALAASDAQICAAPFVPLQRAKAQLRWTGSWYTALVAIDPMGSESDSAELLQEITDYLAPFRRMGQDLLVAPAIYVPLKVSVTVCVATDYLRGHVEAAVAARLGNRMLPDGTLGFFHPDNLTFGDGVYVSALLAAVQAVPGVENAMVTELERYEIAEPDAAIDQSSEELPVNAALLLSPLEIAQLDNDPNFPENGVLVLDLRGGR